MTAPRFSLSIRSRVQWRTRARVHSSSAERRSRALSQAAAACPSVFPLLLSLALSSCLFLRSNFSESEFVTKVFLCAEEGRCGRGLFASDIADLTDGDGASPTLRGEGSRLTVKILERRNFIKISIEGAMSAFYAFRFWHG